MFKILEICIFMFPQFEDVCCTVAPTFTFHVVVVYFFNFVFNHMSRENNKYEKKIAVTLLALRRLDS